jgi:hypothetical protein
MTVLIVPVSQVNRLGTIPQPDNIVVLPTLAPYRKFLVKVLLSSLSPVMLTKSEVGLSIEVSIFT